MIAGVGYAHMEEVRMAEHCVRSREPTAGCTVDPDLVDVDPRMTRGKLPDSCDVVRKTIVSHVAVVIIVEPLGAAWRAKVVELDDDEPELRERTRLLTPRAETPRSHRARLRARVDVRDDRILLRRIE